MEHSRTQHVFRVLRVLRYAHLCRGDLKHLLALIRQHVCEQRQLLDQPHLQACMPSVSKPTKSPQQADALCPQGSISQHTDRNRPVPSGLTVSPLVQERRVRSPNNSCCGPQHTSTRAERRCPLRRRHSLAGFRVQCSPAQRSAVQRSAVLRRAVQMAVLCTLCAAERRWQCSLT